MTQLSVAFLVFLGLFGGQNVKMKTKVDFLSGFCFKMRSGEGDLLCLIAGIFCAFLHRVRYVQEDCQNS